MSDAVLALIRDTEAAWNFHKSRGREGQIEAAAARVRHVALRDCWRIVDPERERRYLAPWQKK